MCIRDRYAVVLEELASSFAVSTYTDTVAVYWFCMRPQLKPAVAIASTTGCLLYTSVLAPAYWFFHIVPKGAARLVTKEIIAKRKNIVMIAMIGYSMTTRKSRGLFGRKFSSPQWHRLNGKTGSSYGTPWKK